MRAASSRSAAIGRVLRACLTDGSRSDLATLLRRQSTSGLVEAAHYHRVVGLVYQALKDLDAGEAVDDVTMRRLERFYRQSLAVHLRVVAELRSVRDALERASVPWLVVKGPALTELAYRRPGLRLYQDLDVLVPRGSFAQALAALEAADFMLVDRNWDLLRGLRIGELVLAQEGGPELDLHWDVRYDGDVRRSVTISTEELVARGRPVTLSGVPARTLDPADTVVYLALHASKQGGDRLVWLKDIEQSIANDPPSWVDVVERSQAGRVHLFVGAMLLRARRTLGAAVPDEVLRELLPSRAWRGLLRGLDRAFPAERSTGFGSPATLVVRSTRDDVASTLRTAGGGLVSRSARLLRDRALRRDTAQDDPDNPASRAFPTGAPDSRERYLEEMMREP